MAYGQFTPGYFGVRRMSLAISCYRKAKSINVSMIKVGIDSAVAINSAAHFVIRAPGAVFP